MVIGWPSSSKMSGVMLGVWYAGRHSAGDLGGEFLGFGLQSAAQP